jgi:rhomboid family protein
VNVIVFLFELGSNDASILRWTVVPAELSQGHHLITALTSMFLHGGFMHIIADMVFLWAFGPAVEDAMGRGRFLFFYLLGGLAAAPHKSPPTPIRASRSWVPAGRSPP